MNTNAITLATPFVAMDAGPITNTSALTAIASIADTLTKPATSLTGGSFVVPAPAGGLCLLEFAGVGADNDTATFQVLTWSTKRMPGSDVIQYTPRVVCEGTLTFGTKTGVASGVIGTTYRYADTITLTNDGGLASSYIRVIGRSGAATGGTNVADQCPQWLAFDRLASELVEVRVRCTGTTSAVHAFLSACGGG